MLAAHMRMPNRSFRSRLRLRSRPAGRHILAALAITAALAAQTVHATPAANGAPRSGSQGDALLQMLHERGVLAPAALAASAADSSKALVRRMHDRASEMVITAMNFLGVPYRRGGNTPDEGFDCSGFTRHIFEHSLGLVLPRRADQQARDEQLRQVKKTELEPGDLVFFNTMRRAFSHVGIYVGDGKFIHAPRTGAEVRVEDMSASYWSRRFNGARRAPVPATMPPPASPPADAMTSAAGPRVSGPAGELPALP
jgi:cell wall-associated NlpC family hydrolase